MTATETDAVWLKGPRGALQLRLAGYQFPSITSDEWDANWLIVQGSASLDGKAWDFEDPCLTNFEAAELADWLDKVVEVSALSSLFFTEPNLEFRLDKAGEIAVFFSLEAAPPWAMQNDEETEYGFQIAVGPQLSNAASALRRQLAQFPVRGPRRP